MRVVLRQIGPGMITKQQVVCENCRGEGETIKAQDRCTECQGEKLKEEQKLLKVEVLLLLPPSSPVPTSSSPDRQGCS